MTTLYVLYNADASVMGKLKYGYRKITCPKDADPECAACDITHGGLSLKETPAWVEAKAGVEASGVKIVQWHRDELSAEVRKFVEDNKVAYPAAIADKAGVMEVVMDNKELAACKGDATAFVAGLKSKGVVS